MKEHKFRVWNISEKKMFLADSIARIHFNKGLPFATMFWSGDAIFHGNMVLQQYIGKKDKFGNKNGKEICEGDILEDHYWNSVWFTKNIEVKIPDIYIWLNGHRIMKGSYYKILGNKYENPELRIEKEK